MKKLLLGLLITAATLAYAIEDTTANRQQQAARYLAANPPQEIFQEIADTTMNALPPAERQPYTDMLTKHLDMVAVSSAMQEAMIKHFTAEELCALADFYNAPGAKSAMGKMRAYMSDVMPVVQSEMMKAQQKAFSQPMVSKTPTAEDSTLLTK